MPYTLPSWADFPSTATPVDAANLTLLNDAIDDLDDRVTDLTMPVPASGQYFWAMSGANTSTATLGNGNLRLHPWYVPRSLSITRIGADVGTVGEAGSKFRLGIYADNGNGYPGALVVDAGQINGDSATVQELTISQTLAPGLYWIGGATQSATTTAPAMRLVGTIAPPMWHMPVGTSMPTSGSGLAGFIQASVTGALPSNFTTTVTASGSNPKIFMKVA